MRYPCPGQPQNRDLEFGPFHQERKKLTRNRALSYLPRYLVNFILIFIFIVPMLNSSSRSVFIPPPLELHALLVVHEFQLQPLPLTWVPYLSCLLSYLPTCTSDLLHIRGCNPLTSCRSHTTSNHNMSDPSRFHNKYAYVP